MILHSTPITSEELAELARHAIAYGDDHGEATRLHAAVPYLGGWHDAMETLQARHARALREADVPFDHMGDLDQGQAPGYPDLVDRYAAMVRKLAGVE
jgi:hypothetical protein